jgi:hypothetical protein
VQHTGQLTASREAARAVPSLATVQIEPFKANERADTDRRTASSEQKPTETAYHFEYGTDFRSSYFAYSDFLARSYHKNKYSEIQTLNMAINEKQMRVDHLNRSGAV